MICRYCNKQIARPLELYNGDWACPRCKKTLNIKAIDVCVTAENDETAKLAELCYLRALKSVGDKSRYDRDVSAAIDYSRTAARMGNPKALIRLGFFYENGYMQSGEQESKLLAAEYYRSVWTGAVRVDVKAEDPDYADGCVKLQNAAAKLYLELLKRSPDIASKSEYAQEKQKVRRKGLYVPEDGAVESEHNRVQSIFNALESCFNEERSPLFGLLRIEPHEIDAVRSYRDGNGAASKLVTLAKKLHIVLFNVDNGGFQTVKTEDNLSSVSADSPHYLYFFNEYGAHGISRSKCAKIGKALKRGNALGDYAGVKRIIEAVGKNMCNADYIFTEDDVLAFKSRWESFERATGAFINSLSAK